VIVPERPFLGCPVVGDLSELDGDVAVLGIPHGVHMSSTRRSN